MTLEKDLLKMKNMKDKKATVFRWDYIYIVCHLCIVLTKTKSLTGQTYDFLFKPVQRRKKNVVQ